MKNWKTTIFGALAGGIAGLDAVVAAYQSGAFDSKTGVQLIVAVAIVLMGAYAKDHNVTGGTTPAK